MNLKKEDTSCKNRTSNICFSRLSKKKILQSLQWMSVSNKDDVIVDVLHSMVYTESTHFQHLFQMNHEQDQKSKANFKYLLIFHIFSNKVGLPCFFCKLKYT